MSRLLPSECHVWMVRTEDADDALVARCRGWMTSDEIERMERYRFERHQRQCAIARGLQRWSLSRYDDVAPEAWHFEAADHGKPFVSRPQTDLRFNVSHTDGLVVCAVTRGNEVGVDVENVERRSETARIAERFFAPPEVKELRALSESEQRERFFAYWTLKESYMKACGLGLALSLKSFWFELDEEIRLCVDDSIDDDPAAWRFRRHEPSRRHRLALATRCAIEDVRFRDALGEADGINPRG